MVGLIKYANTNVIYLWCNAVVYNSQYVTSITIFGAKLGVSKRIILVTKHGVSETKVIILGGDSTGHCEEKERA